LRIFFAPDGSDPMIMDTRSGLHAFYGELAKFLKGPDSAAAFPAATDRSPDPYQEFLPGIRVVKGRGEPRLILDADRWLVLTGAPDTLEACAKLFLVAEEDGHTHLYAAPVSLIIESDSHWGQSGEP
jgi:hypothetical protein